MGATNTTEETVEMHMKCWLENLKGKDRYMIMT